MLYEIIYTRRAVKDLSKLDSKTRERIWEALERYAEAPLSYAKKMADPALGTYRFRSGIIGSSLISKVMNLQFCA